MVTLAVVGVLVLLSQLLVFIIAWRGQSLASRNNTRLYDAHQELLEYLVVAANPRAWVVKQADKAREERRTEAAEKDEYKTEGVF